METLLAIDALDACRDDCGDGNRAEQFLVE
jgi:hypothetical protein